MKITIEGEIDLSQLGIILNAINKPTPGKLEQTPELSGTVQGNFAPIERDFGMDAVQGSSAIIVPEKTRTRRTKAEMELAAGPKGEPGIPGINPPPTAAVNGSNAIDFEELKAFAQEKAQTPENVPKIKAKLKEFGVTKTKELPVEHHNAYWVYLQTLQTL